LKVIKKAYYYLLYLLNPLESKEVFIMQKASMLGAIILSWILPGAGLLLVKKGGWFATYLIFDLIGIIGLFLFGLGIFILIPVWIISFIHTVVAVNNNNKFAVAG
jgi:hypothetical protein